MNKRTLEVEERLAKLRCDPITVMARIAMNKKTPVELRVRMAAKLAQYIAPKRRATEYSGAINLVESFLLDVPE
jgi:hypothetical protein